MNILEFKAKIDYITKHARELETIQLGVEITTLGSIGGTPIVPITTIFKGFDWDNNKVIIKTSEALRRVDINEIEKLRKEARSLGWSVYKYRRLQAENKKLKERNSFLEDLVKKYESDD